MHNLCTNNDSHLNKIKKRQAYIMPENLKVVAYLMF